jgi:hypothetical protein
MRHFVHVVLDRPAFESTWGVPETEAIRRYRLLTRPAFAARGNALRAALADRTLAARYCAAPRRLAGAESNEGDST